MCFYIDFFFFLSDGSSDSSATSSCSSCPVSTAPCAPRHPHCSTCILLSWLPWPGPPSPWLTRCSSLLSSASLVNATRLYACRIILSQSVSLWGLCDCMVASRAQSLDFSLPSDHSQLLLLLSTTLINGTIKIMVINLVFVRTSGKLC